MVVTAAIPFSSWERTFEQVSTSFCCLSQIRKDLLRERDSIYPYFCYIKN
jgi:hypothetical protein